MVFLQAEEDETSNIWIAASDGNLELVKSFISNHSTLCPGENPFNLQDENGYSPLSASVSYNHFEVVRYLLLPSLGQPHDNDENSDGSDITRRMGSGADIELEDGDGDTPLFYAESVEMARMLVDQGHANWRHVNKRGLNVLEKIIEEYAVGSLEDDNGESREGGASSSNVVDDGSNSLPLVEEDNIRELMKYYHFELGLSFRPLEELEQL